MIPFSPRRSPTYTGDGVAVDFAFAFKVFTTADVAVRVSDLNGVETQLDLGADYSVLLNVDQSNFPGGTVTLTSPLASGHKLVVIGALEYKQSTQLPNGGSYNASVVERALDSLSIQNQQLLERADRTLILAATSGDGVSTTLPVPVAISVIGWDATGAALRNYNPGDLGVAVSYANWRTQLFNGDGVTTSFVLSADAGVASNIDLRVANVPQTPGVNFSYNPVTFTITFLTGAPSAGTGNVVARYGQALPQGVVPDNGVTSDKIAAGAVTTTKILDSNVTFAKVQNIATARFLGRTTAGSGVIEELTAAQMRAGIGADNAANLTSGDVAAARIATALNASGSAPLFVCRAWVVLNGTGTPAIRGSGNVSSITDLGVGTYRVNFTTAMPTANYSWAFGGNNDGTNNAGILTKANVTPAVGSFDFIVSATAGAVDTTYACVQIFC